ncbi:tetratricopeptide repeat protein [Segnochrobactrum spirostomi]|nr:tetratricopeptide repeat protein [Segnochrobactrum spirostomi]
MTMSRMRLHRPIATRAAGALLALAMAATAASAAGGGGGGTSGGGSGGSTPDRMVAVPGGLPTSPQTYAKAVALIKAGHYQQGYDLLAASGMQDADTLNYMGYASRKLGHLKAAETYYKRALAVNPNHIGALEYYGEALVKMGRIDQAKRNLARLETLCGMNCEEYHDLAHAIASGKPS